MQKGVRGERYRGEAVQRGGQMCNFHGGVGTYFARELFAVGWLCDGCVLKEEEERICARSSVQKHQKRGSSGHIYRVVCAGLRVASTGIVAGNVNCRAVYCGLGCEG